MNRVSVVVRTWNEATHIAETLRAVFAQRDVEPEVIVVDSESADDTVRLAATFPVRLITLPHATFSYGRALNVGAAAATAPLIANLSAHALPFDRHWLRNLTRPFADPLVDGVVGKTLPRADCNPFDRRGLLRHYGVEARTLCDGQAPCFSNANSAIRRDAWLAEPFDETLPYSEDLLWARRRQGRGRRLVYAPDAAVYHSHNETPLQLRRRFWNESRALESIDPGNPAYRPHALAWDFAAGVLYDWLTLARQRARPSWFWFAPRRRGAIDIGRFAGARGIALLPDGRLWPRLLQRSALRVLARLGALAGRLAPRVVVLTRKHPRPLHPKHLLDADRDHFWCDRDLAGGRLALDVGCNVGAHANFAAKQGLAVIGMDVDRTALGHARFLLSWERAARALIVEADAERPFPFADAAFDRVLAFDVIEHVADDARLLDEIGRVLAPGGVLLLSAPNVDTTWKKRFRAAGLPFFADPTHQIEYTRAGLERTLRDAGFVVVREEPTVLDTPAAPLYDLLGAFSLTLYRKLAARKRRLALARPGEATGFRIVAQKAGR